MKKKIESQSSRLIIKRNILLLQINKEWVHGSWNSVLSYLFAQPQLVLRTGNRLLAPSLFPSVCKYTYMNVWYEPRWMNPATNHECEKLLASVSAYTTLHFR
jgi:hypothetical protein